jgi:YD repeat-containing protein
MTKDLDVAELVAPAPVAGSLTAIVPIIDVETDYGVRTDYQPVYLGTAPPGTPTSAPLWAIRQLTYDASSRLLSILNATGAWTARATLTYS